MAEASGTTIEQTHTVKEVAEASRISSRAVRFQIAAGNLAAINIGTGNHRPIYRIAASELERFLTGRAVPSGELNGAGVAR